MKIFDAHFHIIDPQFPLQANQGYWPPAYVVADYQAEVAPLDVEWIGGAVVSGSFQGLDHGYLMAALPALGAGYFGVVNLPLEVSVDALEGLHQLGVVAQRINVKRGGSGAIEQLAPKAQFLFERFGWHTELYVDSKDLPDLAPYLDLLPSFSIDHLGLSQAGLSHLYHWVERGAKVKATGFGRVDFDPIPVLQQIHAINPTALLFGTDLPSTRAPVPFSKQDLQLLVDHFEAADLAAILHKNALEFYTKSSAST